MITARTPASLAAAIGMLAAVTLTATACSSPRTCAVSPVEPGLAIAVGNRANVPQASWPTQLDPQLTRIITATQRAAARDGAGQQPAQGVTFIRVDGRPAVGCVETFDATGANGPAQRQNAQNFTGGVTLEVSALRAARPQADPLAALNEASAAAGPGGTVVLIDSGLQTVPPLDFASEDLLDADISSVVSQLRAAGELPRLHGQTVIFDGLGYTAPPQARWTRASATRSSGCGRRSPSRAGRPMSGSS